MPMVFIWKEAGAVSALQCSFWRCWRPVHSKIGAQVSSAAGRQLSRAAATFTVGRIRHLLSWGHFAAQWHTGGLRCNHSGRAHLQLWEC